MRRAGFVIGDPMENKKPRVGVGVLIFKNNKILLGKRKGSHAQGQWACPGGHLEFGETFEECAHREVLEECGLDVSQITLQCVSNETIENKHYVNIMMKAEWTFGEPQLCEPEKNEGWRWFALDEVPEELFIFCKHGIESYKTGKMYLGSL